MTAFDTAAWLDTTRLVEEVPHVPESERYYISHRRSVVWQGSTAEEGRNWAEAHGILIQQFEPYEP